METRTISVLGGTLRRAGRNEWIWSDGTPEPRVTDLSPDEWNFRCRTYGDGNTYAEVLLSVAHRERSALGWVLDGVAAGRYEQDTSGDHTGPWMITDDGIGRMRIEPGEDPLCGSEPIIHRRAIPRVALVPVAEWDAWVREHPAGAIWDKEHEPQLLAIAERLGWRAAGK